MRRIILASPSDPAYRLTADDLTEEGVIDSVVAPFFFDRGGPVQTLVHRLKYEQMTAAGILLGKHVAACMTGRHIDLQDAVIVPVPLHRAKLRERGYNQAEFIARGMSSELGVCVQKRGVRRCVYTKTQTQLGREERRRNVDGAFDVDKAAAILLARKTVLLVDDVVTTGATMRACADVLKGIGVGRIIACAAALAPERSP